MKAVVTVVGKDKSGIIARVTEFLANKGANVEDISQTVLQNYFAMIMLGNGFGANRRVQKGRRRTRKVYRSGYINSARRRFFGDAQNIVARRA